jgi:hypothetical protein
MNLQISFENSVGNWSVKNVFNRYYEKYIKNNHQYNFTYVNSSLLYDNNPSSFYSPHIMVIKNMDNKKYMIISYWDRAFDLTFSVNGWDHNNCVEIITSSGVFENMEFTPFSYLPYDIQYDEFSKKSKSIIDKELVNLFFRGKLYGLRHDLYQTNKININQNIINIKDYFNELNSNKISLSLNGAGEICNRDIEILSSKSVLLRLELKQKLHNPLIPNYHYVSYEYNEDPTIQSEIIVNKFNEIKNDIDYLKFISENGYKWYCENGTIDSNVNLLNKLINFEKLK